jgi:hypothetical protein
MNYLDIETLDFFQSPHIRDLPRDRQMAAMRFGCAVLVGEGGEEVYLHDIPEQDVVTLWERLTSTGEPVVGWNLIAFDWPVICGNAARAGVADPGLITPRFVDLMALIRDITNQEPFGSCRQGRWGGRWYSLNAVAQANLGRSKTGDGQQASEWLASGDPALRQRAIDYCRHDVLLVRDLHQRLLAGQPLLLPPRAERGEVGTLRFFLNNEGKAGIDVERS